MVASLEEKKHQAEIDLENKYMDRLDELLSQVLAIDAAVKKYSFINEKRSYSCKRKCPDGESCSRSTVKRCTVGYTAFCNG